MPEQFSYLWQWFVELASSGETLNFTELKAWSELTGNPLAHWEVSILKQLDSLRRKQRD